ncbi:amp-binding enzyme [Diplodia corticola]|uniref:Amp-binding enzyme n=1 Tax=Diplodia corticola TaxID=236234 RepID=A0A1J9QZ77_9PEZI|nr:amp-binding enzyme [Diplodia corticola]OJD33681.1 amp-binding enzyme [Diplodia corticola]
MLENKSLSLPDEPHFRQLIQNHDTIRHVIFRDLACQADADYAQLLFDIAHLRRRIVDNLPASALDGKGRIREERPYICTLAPAGYEFLVAALAVLSIGAAIVPLAPEVLPVEALYFLKQCRADLLLTSSRCSPLGDSIEQYVRSHGQTTTFLPIKPSVMARGQQQPVAVDPEMTIPADRPSLILFTSGSTGPPKGVVHNRRFFHSGYGTSSSPSSPDLFLTHRPVHWIGGLRSIINLAISGTPQEVVAEPTAPAIWHRLRDGDGDVTMLCCVIPMWIRLMEHFRHALSRLPAPELEPYLRGARALRVARVGGAAPQPSLLRFWREELGVPLEVTYGCTETGGPGLMTDERTDRDRECNLGRPEEGVEVRLSEGDRGEILIRNSRQFSQKSYLNDDEATRNALTEDGFFKTGDYGRRVGDEYTIEGRQATDFVRFHGFKVPVVEVEMRLLELPFISQACIVSVPDGDASTRVAALVRFNGDGLSQGLAELREELSATLAQYKLPTALRVLQPSEKFPVTFTGKVLRKKVVEQYFPTMGTYELPRDVELWDLRSKGQQGAPHKAWDWAGLQGC